MLQKTLQAVIEETMKLVPEGSITLRDDRIGKIWNVSIAPFMCARYPVTRKHYNTFTGENPSTFNGDSLPVESVSWNDAVRFCNVLSDHSGLQRCYRTVNAEVTERVHGANGYRLLTDAEWEYACRAGSSEGRYGSLDTIAWYKVNSDGTPHGVGEKKPNDFGLFDMIGNVWEWCEDVYDPEVYGTYRIFRGGGWNDTERGCLASNRRRSHPTFAIDDLGFRIARSIVRT